MAVKVKSAGLLNAGAGGTRARAGKVRRPSLLWRHRRIIFVLGLGSLAALAGLVFVLARVPLPPLTAPVQTTFLTDANGAPLAAFNTGQNRVTVPLSKVPRVLINAVVATEDRNFFHEGAVSPIGIVRAVWADVRGRPLQGASTITQQLVKQTYVGSERSLWRKLKEAALAVKLNRKLSKDQILDRYLNTIYFGRGAYGVQAASQAYFGVDVSQVNLVEAAYLAGLIRSPETADAYRDPATAKLRRDLTLRSMERSGYINDAQRQAGEATPLTGKGGYVIADSEHGPTVLTQGGTAYFVQYVRQLLIARYGRAEVDGGGLRVKTSLDLHTQQLAYDSVYGFLKPGEPSGALVSIDQNGEIKAMVGGRDFAHSQVNLATGRQGGGSGRQAGSTFKPFLLAETIKEGYNVESSFAAPAHIDLPEPGGKTYRVSNYSNESFPGKINLIEATKNSVNTVYAQLQAIIGPQKLVDEAHALGVTSKLAADPSLVLGTADVSVLEMAGAYSTFANDGIRVTPRAILEVRTADGRVLQPDRAQRIRVLAPSVADTVNLILQQVVKSGTGTAAAIGRPVAGKTGTTEHSVDAWFIGYTPQLTTAVWMGYPSGDSKPMTSVRGINVTGGTFPAQMFQHFMSRATRPMPVEPFHSVSSFSGRVLQGSLVPFSTTTSAPASSGGATTTTSPNAAGPSISTLPPGGATTTTANATPGSTVPGPAAPPTTTTAPSPTTTLPPTPTTRPPPTTTSLPPR
ncbi:MAG: transglycosylase domain-containing protein [Acidimicrobiales bacterium]